MSVPFWGDPSVPEQAYDPGAGSPWDTAYLNGVQVPGYVRCEGDGPGRKIDVKSGPGVDGASETQQGAEPAKFTMTVRMWTKAQWDAWQALADTISPRLGKTPAKPVDIAHPNPNAQDVKSVLVEKISLVKVTGQVGELTVRLLQWTKPVPSKVTTPKGSGAGLASLTPGVSSALLPPIGPPKPPSTKSKTTSPTG
jgi:hypothetical protein